MSHKESTSSLIPSISTLKEPSGVRNAIKVGLFGSQSSSLVFARQKSLDFHHVDSKTSSFQHNESVEIDSAILELISFKDMKRNRTWVLTLSEDRKVKFYTYDEAQLLVFLSDHLTFECTPNPVKIEKPRMQILSDNDGDQFVFINYFFGQSLLLNLTEHISTTTDSLVQEKRRDMPFGKYGYSNKLVYLQLDEIYITDIAVNSSRDTLAILYHDTEFNFGIKFYNFVKHSLRVLKNHQILFAEPPSIIIPTSQDGFFVLSDIYAYYISPLNRSEYKIHKKNKDQGITKGHDCIMKKLCCNSRSRYIGEQWTHSTYIDETRFLLISDTGTTCLLYFDVKIKGSLTILKSISFLNLGKLTIASSLLHVNANLFIAPSWFSQSLLFKVVPEDPYLEVIHWLESSPPILNITNSTTYGPLICAGGFASGEITVLLSSEYSFEMLKSFKAPPESWKFKIDAFNIYILGPTNQILKKFDLKNWSSELPTTETNIIDYRNFNDLEYVLSDSNFTIGTNVVYVADITHGAILPKSVIILERPGLLKRLPFDGNGPVWREIQDIENLTCLEVVDEYITLGYSSGHFSLLRMNDFSVVYQGQLDEPDPIWSSNLIRQYTSIKLVFLSGVLTISIFEIDADSGLAFYTWSENYFPDDSSVSCKNNIYTLIERKSLLSDPPILMFNGRELFELSHNNGIYSKRNIHSFSSSILEAKWTDLTFQNIVVLLESSAVEVLKLQKTPSKKSYFSNMIYGIDCLESSEYSVIISQETSHPTRYSLKTINATTMNVIDQIYMEKGCGSLIDLAVSSSGLTQQVVILRDNPEFLMVFKMVLGKLSRVNVKFPELKNKNDKFHKIRTFNGSKRQSHYYISGSSNMVLSLGEEKGSMVCRFDRSIEWKSPSITIDSKPLSEDLMCVCDLTDGLFYLHRNNKSTIEARPETVTKMLYSHHYITAFEAFDIGHLRYVIYGDALGNIGVFTESLKASKPNLPKVINIGESITAIKKRLEFSVLIGTSCGGLYLLNFEHEDSEVEQMISRTSQVLSDYRITSRFQQWKTINQAPEDQKYPDNTKILDLTILERVLTMFYTDANNNVSAKVFSTLQDNGITLETIRKALSHRI